MRIGNQEIKELQVINTEYDLIISITDDDRDNEKHRKEDK